MRKFLSMLVAGTVASGMFAYSASGEEAATVEISRLDCGRSDGPTDMSIFSDTRAYDGRTVDIVVSCYLVRHGDRLLLWDTGFPKDAPPGMGFLVGESLVDQLAEQGIEPADIEMIGISHYHFDHIGQSGDFPDAELVVGADDWAALREAAEHGAPEGFGAPDPAPLAHWISGDGEVRTVAGDHDIFGDGSVVMVETPGHTPGHRALLVNLAETGPVLLTGDLAHFLENYEKEGVPSFNTDRADTLASFARFKEMADNLGAMVVIQHEPSHVDLLPAFPDAAR